MYNQFLDLEQIKPSKKSSKAFSTWQKVMINTCFDNLSGRAKSVRCFRQTEFLHSVCALNSYDATRTSRAIIDLSYIIWICIYIYMRIICLLDIVQKKSWINVKFCLCWSIARVYPKKHDVNCHYIKWHFSNTVLIDVLTFTSSVTGNSIHQQKPPKNTHLPAHRHQQGCSIHLQLFKGWYKTCWWIQALRRNTGHQG